MAKLVTTAQMAELEAEAIAGGLAAGEMMAQAGLAAAQEAWMAVGAMSERGILFLVGPGNNGGDALVAARELSEWGGVPFAYLLRPRPDDDPVWQAFLAAELPYLVAPEDDPTFERLEGLLDEASAVVDGLLGTGQRPGERPIEGALAEIVARLGAAGERLAPPQIVALDLPTGVDGDSGFADPLAVRADLTVTFGFAKVGLYQAPGRQYAGRVVPVEIGLPAEAAAGLPYEELRLRDLKAVMPERPDDAHKGTFGTVTVAAGSRRYPGAARLASEAAARSGAGLVQLAAPAEIQPLVAPGLPDVIHEPLPATGGALDAAAAAPLLGALSERGSRALLVGPGLSLGQETREFLAELLAGLGDLPELAAVVFDADALTILSEREEWWSGLTVPRILTPHAGEMARLTGASPDEVQAARLERAVAYAGTSGSVVVLKGACTVVTAPSGEARISEAANAMLASAGTGDVLAGLIAGLVAQGLAPFDAASAGVYVHADMGRRVAERLGTAAGLAQDLLAVAGDSRRMLESQSSAQTMPDLGGMGQMAGMGGGLGEMGGLPPGFGGMGGPAGGGPMPGL